MFDFNSNYQKIQELIRYYRGIKARAQELFDEKGIYEHQKDELFARFGNRYGNVGDSEARVYTEQELTQLRLELANSAGLWALIKSMLGFGKSQRDVYRELMGKLTGLLNFMENQIRNCRSEADAVWYKLQEISEEYAQAYRGAMCYGGCTADSDWNSYTIPETLENPRIFLGDLLRPLMTEEEYEELSVNGKPLFELCRDGERLAVPWGFVLSAPVQIRIDYTSRTADRARQILQSIVYQTLRSIPQYYMEFHFMDAVTSGNDFRDFIRLQQVKKNDIVMLNRKVTGGSYHLAQSYLKSEDISRGLTGLVQRMTSVINEKAAYTTVTEYNAEQGMDAWIPYQMIIVQNLHDGYSDGDLKNIQYLIENGRNLGIFVIILNNTDRWEGELTGMRKRDLESCFSAEAMQNLCRINVSTEVSTTCVKGIENDFRHWQTGGSHLEFIEAVVEQLAAEKKQDNEFQRIFDINAPFGQMDSTNGLHIPFAVNQRGDIISYSLGQALNAHGLICGGTGSGKSSLLHMLISSIVMNYTPEDVEIWLSDYKITEFYSYKTNTPPHIRFIGLSKTSDFSYAFLDKIINEMNRRQAIIAQADYDYKAGGGKSNITSFGDYRKVYGKNSMTRLLIIVDEFHVMSQHAQLEAEYKTKLENILSEARALGIILLLSDQAIVDGLRGLSDKGKKQIKARIALSNYKDELEETLNEKEPDKIRSFIHMKVGEVAVQTIKENEDREEVPTIERAMAIYINGTCRYNVNEKARAVYHAEQYEADVFDDRVVDSMKIEEIDQWERENLIPHRDGSKDLHIYLGRPVNLGFALHFPLFQRKGNNIMCASGTEEQQMRILRAVVASFTRQSDFAVNIMADRYASVYREYNPEILELGRNYPEIRVHDNLEDICYEIVKMLETIKDRGNTRKQLNVWLGLDSMADILADEKNKKTPVLKTPETKEVTPEPERTEETEKSKVNDMALDEFNSLFGDMDLFGEDKEEKAEETETQTSYRYDARNDIARIIHLGPTCNVFNLVIYDSASALRDFREVKTLDFNHKIAFPMSDYEAGEFLEQPRLIRELSGQLAYYHNGRSGNRFVPYKL